MKNILIRLVDLQSIVQAASNDNMTYLKLSVIQEEFDQNVINPSFLHVEAFTEGGLVKDYETIDSVNFIKVS